MTPARTRQVLPIRATIRRLAGAGMVAAVIATTPAPALAQNGDEQARIRKLEAEVRALQRRVFPGGSGRFFEPEISAPQGQGGSGAGQPSTSAVTDILARLDALEAQIQSLTATSEVNANQIAQLTTRLAAVEGGNGARMADAAGGESASGSNLAAMSGGASTVPASRNATPTPATPTPASTSAATGPSADRLAAVRAIAKPQTDDAADDEYSYGFRLWDAGFYPEAQQQLSLFVEQHPNHWRTTYGRNLLGRAYLDDGKPREAAPWFLQNYQTDKTAARAADSLLFLGEAMIAMGDTNRACIALAEFGETYPAIASGRLSDRYQANLAKVSCN